jgi:hypothetical protein
MYKLRVSGPRRELRTSLRTAGEIYSKNYKKQLTSNTVKHDETPTSKKNNYKVMHIKKLKVVCKSTKQIINPQIHRYISKCHNY